MGFLESGTAHREVRRWGNRRACSGSDVWSPEPVEKYPNGWAVRIGSDWPCVMLAVTIRTDSVMLEEGCLSIVASCGARK
jgi:hypothetical protein